MNLSKTIYPKTDAHRRRKTFVDGSYVIVGNSGY